MDVWLQSLLATGPTIYGNRLLPVSLAHVYILRGYESPYAIGGHASSIDLHFALAICSRTLAECRRYLFGPVSPQARAMFAAARHGSRRFSTAEKSFRQYLADCIIEPTHIGGGGKPWRAPWEHHVARVLRSVYGMGADAAWDYPICRALCDYSLWREGEGDDSLMSVHEAEAHELIEKAQRLANEGHTEEAEGVYAQAQRAFEAANGFSVQEIAK